MRTIAVAGVVGLLLLGVVYAWAVEATKPGDSPINQALVDPRVVKVRFGDRIYAVPRRYLIGVSQPTSTNSYASIYIQAVLPPQIAGQSSRVDQRGWGDRIRALFEYGRHPRAPKDILNFYLQLANKSENDFRLIGSGYRFYEFKYTSPREIYFKPTSKGDLFFYCESTEEFPTIKYPSCTINEYIENNTGVIYHFSKIYIDKTSEIDSWLRDLMHSFLVN